MASRRGSPRRTRLRWWRPAPAPLRTGALDSPPRRIPALAPLTVPEASASGEGDQAAQAG